MAKYTFYKYHENEASVVSVLANTANIPTHTVVTISAGAVTVKASVAAAGDFLVWRPYPTYGIVGDRYGKIAGTPIATSKGPATANLGELYGFVLKSGDTLIVEDAASINGLTNGLLVTL